MQVFLIGSGPFDETDFKKFIDEKCEDDNDCAFIGVDLGALRLKQLGYPISLAVGDFDSISAGDLVAIKEVADEVKELPIMKDDTDTEIAVEKAFERWPGASFFYFGGLGGRLDHTLSNIWLAFQPRYHAVIENISFVGKDDVLQYLLPGKHNVAKYNGMKYLSFVALTPIIGLTLTDVVYTLDNHDMKFPLALISNEFTESANEMTCEFNEGILLVVQSRDAQ